MKRRTSIRTTNAFVYDCGPRYHNILHWKICGKHDCNEKARKCRKRPGHAPVTEPPFRYGTKSVALAVPQTGREWKDIVADLPAQQVL